MPGQISESLSLIARGREPHEAHETLGQSMFVTLLKMVKRTLFWDHELDTEIVARLQFRADRLLRLLIRQ